MESPIEDVMYAEARVYTQHGCILNLPDILIMRGLHESNVLEKNHHNKLFVFE